MELGYWQVEVHDDLTRLGQRTCHADYLSDCGAQVDVRRRNLAVKPGKLFIHCLGHSFSLSLFSAERFNPRGLHQSRTDLLGKRFCRSALLAA